MATFYIQLEDRLLQISGELTAENISKALGYVPVDSSTMNNYATKDEVSDLVDMSMVEELSQRVDNITFDSLKDNPFLQDGSGELNVTDEAGNIIAKIDSEGIHSIDFIAGVNKLSEKADKTYVDEAVKNVEVDLTGYATETYVDDKVSNIDFYEIKDNPIVNNGDGKLLFVDENGYIGLQLEENGLYVKDVIADGHTLSQKADKSELSNYATKEDIKNIASNSVVSDIKDKVDILVGEDTESSVRDIAIDVLTETLVKDNAIEAYDTLEEVSEWIKNHPEDAAAMNVSIQKNTTDITNLDAAYKAADTKVLTDAQEYTDESVADIDFYGIKNNPIVNSEDGTLTFVDEQGYIGLKVTEEGLIVNDVVTPEHTLSNKADKSELPTKVSELENDKGYITLDDVPEVEIPSMDGYVTDEELSQKGFLTEHQDISHLASRIWVENQGYANQDDLLNISFNDIQGSPIIDDTSGEFNILDENGNVGIKLNSDGLYVKDVITEEHVLSNKLDVNVFNNTVDNLYSKSDITITGKTLYIK